MKTILIAAFTPFGGETVNPALLAAERIEKEGVGSARVTMVTLSVVKDQCWDELRSAIEAARPDAVIVIGQAGGRTAITPERVAINVNDFRIPDNGGNQPTGEPVIPGGPAAYWSTLPIKAIEKAMREAGVPAEISNTAGTFVCNHIFYHLMAYAETHPEIQNAGFIHVPYLPEQAVGKPGAPSMDLGTMVKGLKAGIQAVLDIKGNQD